MGLMGYLIFSTTTFLPKEGNKYIFLHSYATKILSLCMQVLLLHLYLDPESIILTSRCIFFYILSADDQFNKCNFTVMPTLIQYTWSAGYSML
jgi:hypothetical protein